MEEGGNPTMSTDTPTPEAVEPTEEEVKEAGKFFSLHIKHGELRSDSDAFIRDLAFAFMARRITARAQAAAQAARDMQQRCAQRLADMGADTSSLERNEALWQAWEEVRAIPLTTPTPPEDDRESLLRDIRTELQRLLDYHGTPHTSERDDFLKLKQIAAALLARLPR
jgi:hypothetical protein